MNLNTPIEKLNRVGATTARRLNRLNINSVEDLFFYFPFRYEDFSQTTLIKDLMPDTQANIIGEVELINNKRSPRKKMIITEAIIKDRSEQIKVIWFNQAFIAKNIKIGDKISLSGKIEEDPLNGLIMKSPNYEKKTVTQNIHTQGLVPIYNLTANLTQKQIRFLIKQIIILANKLEDWLPTEIIKSQNLISLAEAINLIHFPKNHNEIKKAKLRLAFNELFLLQMQSLLTSQELSSKKADIIKFKESATKNFVASLPFKLTNAQKKAAWKILQDMEKPHPMSRLLEGDVGSGKTIVAIIAILNTSLNKKQSVLMVPTEILAKQHYKTFLKLFEKTDFKIALYTRTEKIINHKNINNSDITKEADIIIGTHALIQEKINFHNLGLAIIDEQHRFGVDQRKFLTANSGNPQTSPHFLTMTATPIPRSMALALYGDLKLSIINELPKGRKKIITNIIPESERIEAYRFVKKLINSGKQAFIICPLIDPSDKLGVKSVNEEFNKLKNSIYPDLNIGLMHGKLKTAEKNQIMNDFLENKINILVSTSVVEVGVDVPNACMMIIEGADRFGLAQLHQFRGRVGRGSDQSYCFLFTDNNSPKTKKRLLALTKYNNGFDLAKIDLQLRGPGEVYGTSQSGFPELHMASLFDYELMQMAREEADKILQTDKTLTKYPKLQLKIKSLDIFHPE